MAVTALPSVATITTALKVLILSLLPMFEGRYALLVGIATGLDPLISFAIASIGVLLLATILPNALAFIDDVAKATGKSKYVLLSKSSKLYLRYVSNVRHRVRKYVDKYGAAGLIIFVAIPLPATGVWTGALGAYLLGMDKTKTMISLLIGGLISNLLTLAAATILT